MTHTFSHLLAMVVAMSISLAAFPVWAAYEYSYTGNNFITFTDAIELPGAYDASMRVTGSFVLAEALLPNLSGHEIIGEVQSISFNDGRQTLDLSNISITSSSVLITTDANGDILVGAVFLQTPFSNLSQFGEILREIYTNIIFDAGLMSTCLSDPCEFGPYAEDSGLININNPGTWEKVALDPIPLPGGLVFISAPIFAVLANVRRRKPKTQE